MERSEIGNTKPLSTMRVLVCGKGGSGKSTVTALMAQVLRDKDYEVHVLDGDASNLGLYWMLGFPRNPDALIDFYGGKESSGGKVTCPVDDPTPLPRGELDFGELPSHYFAEENGILFFRSGKIERVFEGCDGPESKVTRDFRIMGNHVTLVDMGAGQEHFGRGIGLSADGIVAVIDPNYTSVLFAKVAKQMFDGLKRGAEPAAAHLARMDDSETARKLADSARLEHFWVILNKIRSAKSESIIHEQLNAYGIRATGAIHEDYEILESALEHGSLRESGARKEMIEIVDQMEAEIMQMKH